MGLFIEEMIAVVVGVDIAVVIVEGVELTETIEGRYVLFSQNNPKSTSSFKENAPYIDSNGSE